MDAAEIIAGVFGPLYVIVAVGLLIHPEPYRAIMQEFLERPALSYLGGLFALVAGLLVLAFHNDWTADWRVLVTLIGWLALAKGVLLTVYPGPLLRLSRWVMSSAATLRFHALVALVFGAFLAYRAYLAG